MTGEEEGRGGENCENDSSILENLAGRGRRSIRGEECVRRKKEWVKRNQSLRGEIKGGESGGVGTSKVEDVEKGIKMFLGEKGKGGEGG